LGLSFIVVGLVVFCGWWGGFRWWGWVPIWGGFVVGVVVGSDVVVGLLWFFGFGFCCCGFG